MGYFSNGTEGLDFEEAFCVRCQNWNRDSRSKSSEEPGCPVMDAHLLFNGEAIDQENAGDTKLSELLGLLIRREPSGANVCEMFLEAK